MNKNIGKCLIVIILALILEIYTLINIPLNISNIYNIGNKNDGFLFIIPPILDEKLFNNILKCSNMDKGIYASYDLLVKDNLSSKDIKNISKKYPLIEKQNIYLLNNLTDEELKILEERIKKPLIINYMLNTDDKIIRDILKLKDEESTKDIIATLDKTSFKEMISTALNELDKLDSKKIESYKLVSFKNINKTLKVNTTYIKKSYNKENIIKLILNIFLCISSIIVLNIFINKLNKLFKKDKYKISLCNLLFRYIILSLSIMLFSFYNVLWAIILVLIYVLLGLKIKLNKFSKIALLVGNLFLLLILNKIFNIFNIFNILLIYFATLALLFNSSKFFTILKEKK